MRIQFWGVRGSLPAPLSSNEVAEKLIRALAEATGVDLNNRRAIREYVSSLPPLVQGTVGGNTPCVSVQAGNQWLIIDAGSGIRNLGLELVDREFGQGRGVAHILISHTHWDHIQGFPFFRPLFVPGNRIVVYSPIPDLEQRLKNQQSPEYFPKTIDEFTRADLSFVQLQEGVPATIGGVRVNTILQDHPGRSYAYRLDADGARLVYASDSEYKNLSPEHTQEYIDFVQDADVLIFDAQYTLEDAFQREDWGHSSPMIGVDLAVRANVKLLLLFHYEHVYNDAQVQDLLNCALEYLTSDPSQPSCQVQLAMEGMTLELGTSEVSTVKQSTMGNTVVLSIGGRLDAETVGRVDHRLNALISDGLETGLIVDLSEMTHLSVAGLKALLRAHERSQVPVVVAGARENVRQVLALVGSSTPSNGALADGAPGAGVPEAAVPLAQYDTVQEALSALEARQYLELRGQILHGRYRVEQALDISTKAGVFKAFDTWIERPVTVKVLSRSLGERANQILLDEARVLARLDHPHILSVHDCVEHKDHLYLIREYLEGQTLASWLQSYPPASTPDPSRVLTIAQDILKGLTYAHERGVIHRYIHPKNVILGDQVKIMNFGLADHPEETWSLTQVVYMSPEQLAQRQVSERSDLYSFGVLLYTLLTGQPPFGADTIKELIDRCIYATPVPPKEINEEIPLPLERTILQLLSKDPRSRQPSTRAVLEELSQIKPWRAP